MSISPKSSRDNGGVDEGVRERRKDRRWWWGWESESAPKTFNSPQSPELRTPVCSSCWVELLLLDPAGTKSTKPVVRQQTPAAVPRIISDSVIHCELTDFIDQLMKNEMEHRMKKLLNL